MPNAPYESYVICTTPRSGSTLLCKLLTATGLAGAPDSHFHDPSVASWCADYGLEFASEEATLIAVFEAARARGRGDTDLFGLRMQRASFPFFMQKLAALHAGHSSDVHRITAAFGRTLFIHLTRSDKLGQAISRVKATQTGLWHRSADGTELERLSAPRDPFYDPDAITESLNELRQHDDDWKAWFTAESVTPMTIAYETLASDPSGVLSTVLARLGQEPEAARGVTPPVAKLSDATNRDWAERYRTDSTGAFH